jgi:hypothetical protein
MSTWLTQLFSGLDKFADILNVGRLIFYTAAGALVCAPLWLLVNLLRSQNLHGQSYLRHLDVALEPLGASMGTVSFWFASMIVGFLIAGAAYVKVVRPLSDTAKKESRRKMVNRDGFPYSYPTLVQDLTGTGKDDPKDFAAWFTAEYFRYVEIVTYLPVGLLLGVSLLVLHNVLFLVLGGGGHDLSAMVESRVALVVTGSLAAVLWVFVWPYYWKPQIILPVLETTESAKCALVRALRDRKRAKAVRSPR